jgi:hypothetical protein
MVIDILSFALVIIAAGLRHFINYYYFLAAAISLGLLAIYLTLRGKCNSKVYYNLGYPFMFCLILSIAIWEAITYGYQPYIDSVVIALTYCVVRLIILMANNFSMTALKNNKTKQFDDLYAKYRNEDIKVEKVQRTKKIKIDSATFKLELLEEIDSKMNKTMERVIENTRKKYSIEQEEKLNLLRGFINENSDKFSKNLNRYFSEVLISHEERVLNSIKVQVSELNIKLEQYNILTQNSTEIIEERHKEIVNIYTTKLIEEIMNIQGNIINNLKEYIHDTNSNLLQEANIDYKNNLQGTEEKIITDFKNELKTNSQNNKNLQNNLLKGIITKFDNGVSELKQANSLSETNIKENINDKNKLLLEQIKKQQVLYEKSTQTIKEEINKGYGSDVLENITKKLIEEIYFIIMSDIINNEVK